MFQPGEIKPNRPIKKKVIKKENIKKEDGGTTKKRKLENGMEVRRQSIFSREYCSSLTTILSSPVASKAVLPECN